MNMPTTFERVYLTLKGWIRSGAFRPGDRLEPAHLSERLNASVTPVRDALHRLAGERLVEAPPHEGFRMPLMTESMLRHLYAWHRDILLLAIGRQKAEHSQSAFGRVMDSKPFETLDAVLDVLASTSDNPEHVAAFRGLTDKLGPYRQFEQEVLEAIDTELEDIVAAISRNDAKALRRALVKYHRRRERVVPRLLELAHDHY